MSENFVHGRVQALVVRGNKILLVKHCSDGEEYWTVPGGGIECGETPEQGALRELKEECGVNGKIISKASEYTIGEDRYYGESCFWSFWVDIGDQEPKLGYDPEFSSGEQILREVAWRSLDEISERDRAWLWAAGLITIPQFYEELNTWSREVVPAKKGDKK